MCKFTFLNINKLTDVAIAASQGALHNLIYPLFNQIKLTGDNVVHLTFEHINLISKGMDFSSTSYGYVFQTFGCLHSSGLVTVGIVNIFGES
jgi:hypothetical protein